MTFDEMIDELQEQFIFNIRNEPKLMDKLHTLWLREEIRQGRELAEGEWARYLRQPSEPLNASGT
tara:strand:+ start:576 stop:770 length:195 start_codon:yes stop_codon:yes gene_type:complete